MYAPDEESTDMTWSDRSERGAVYDVSLDAIRTSLRERRDER
jgi:hypothetical protein